MQTILIICSLLLGFIQGYKKKRKKLLSEINLKDNEIAELKARLNDEIHKNRLSMFKTNYNELYDNHRFEEKIVEYYTTNMNRMNLLAAISVMEALVTDTQHNYFDLESQIRIQDLNYLYNDYKNFTKTLKTPFTLNLTVQGKIYCLDYMEEFNHLIKSLTHLEIQRYDITYQQYLDSCKYIAENVISN